MKDKSTYGLRRDQLAALLDIAATEAGSAEVQTVQDRTEGQSREAIARRTSSRTDGRDAKNAETGRGNTS